MATVRATLLRATTRRFCPIIRLMRPPHTAEAVASNANRPPLMIAVQMIKGIKERRQKPAVNVIALKGIGIQPASKIAND